jgi:FAD/FMN-containing dehydrogenase
MGGIAALPATLSLPALIRPSKARPTDGVVFVEAGTAQADTLSLQYNLSYSTSPRLRAICQTAEAAADMVRWARETDTRFAIRSGGHCYGGTSNHAQLVIDLRELNHIDLDPSAGRVKAQSGAKLAQLNRAAFPHNLAPAAGWCGDVGLGGHIQGGGLGYLARANGLLCDSMQAATLIDANGTVHRCSAEDNADLFWACRGGGGGLGLVTDFEIALQRVTETHSIRIFGGIPASQMPVLVHRWMGWSLNAPRETSSQMTVTPMSDGRMFATITGLSTEHKDQLLRALREVCAGDLPVEAGSLITGSFERVMEDTVLSIPHFYLHSAYHTAVFGEVLAADQIAPILEKALETRTEAGSVAFLIEAMGGAIADVAVDATAFPYREGAFVMTASLGTVSDAMLAANRQGLDAIGDMMWSNAVGKGYVNYRDRSLVDYERAYWGPNVERLRAVKRRIDPDGVFGGQHTIKG